MTSAWIASTLGVAGTIIGAAVGSLALNASSAFFNRTLDRGRTLIVQTSDGSKVETQAEPGGTQEALAAVEDATGSPVSGAEVVDDEEEGERSWKTLPWKRIAISTLATLVIAFAVMSAYEAVSGRAFGTDPDAPRISSPFSGGGSSSQDQDQQDDGGGSSDTDGQDDQGTDTDPSDPTQPEEEPEPTATPSPTSEPTTPAPTRTPAPTATPPG